LKFPLAAFPELDVMGRVNYTRIVVRAVIPSFPMVSVEVALASKVEGNRTARITARFRRSTTTPALDLCHLMHANVSHASCVSEEA